MSLVLDDIAVVHVPRTGGMYRDYIARYSGLFSVHDRRHCPVRAGLCFVPVRDPVEWLASFVTNLCSGTGWHWPWFSAAVDICGLRPLSIAEIFVYKPRRWRDLVAKKCRRWNFDTSLTSRDVCEGFLDSGLFMLDWLSVALAIGEVRYFDYTDSFNVMNEICGGRLDRSFRDTRINSIPHDGGASFSEDMVREIYRQHAKANL